MYRDPQLGLDAEIGGRRAEITALLASLEGPRRFVLGPELLRQLSMASNTLFSADDLAAEGAGLAELLDAARAAVAAARDVPTFTLRFKGEPVPFLLPEPYQLVAKEMFERDVATVVPDATFERSADRGYAAHGMYDGVPVIHQMKVAPDERDDGPTVAEWTQSLLTGVPRSLPAFAIRLEGTWDRLKSGAGLAREARIGSAAFDERFWLDGPPDFIEAMFASDLDDALMAFDALESITHDGGKLEMAWRDRGETARAYALFTRIARALTPSA